MAEVIKLLHEDELVEVFPTPVVAGKAILYAGLTLADGNILGLKIGVKDVFKAVNKVCKDGKPLYLFTVLCEPVVVEPSKDLI